MASLATRSSMPAQYQWFLAAAATLLCALLGYIVYGAVRSTAANLLRRLLVVSPLLLVMAVHWLSSSRGLNLHVPGSEPAAIHHAGGSPWGIGFLLLLLLFLISTQPSQRLHASVLF